MPTVGGGRVVVAVDEGATATKSTNKRIIK